MGETSKGVGQGLGIATGLISAPILIVGGVLLIGAFSCVVCVIMGSIGG